MKETVVLLKTGEEFVYQGMADVSWDAENRVVEVCAEEIRRQIYTTLMPWRIYVSVRKKMP